MYERGNMTFWGRKRIKIAPGIYLNASSNGLEYLVLKVLESAQTLKEIHI